MFNNTDLWFSNEQALYKFSSLRVLADSIVTATAIYDICLGPQQGFDIIGR